MSIQFDLPWQRVDSWFLCLYISYLAYYKMLAPSTLRSHFSGLNFFFKSLLKVDFTDDHNLKQIFKSVSKSYQPTLQRKPITFKLLSSLLNHVSNTYSDPYYNHAFCIIYSLMYFLALCISEIADYSDNFCHALLLNFLF